MPLVVVVACQMSLVPVFQLRLKDQIHSGLAVIAKYVAQQAIKPNFYA